MKKNPWAINLNLDLQKTKFHPEQLKELEKRLFFPCEDEDDIFQDAFDLLVTDRSPEAVKIMRKLAFSVSRYSGDSSYGMEGLALIGKGAIPQIMEVLLCKEHDKVFGMIDALFNPIGIQDIKYVSLPNLIFFRRAIKDHPQWTQVINYISCEKHNARGNLKETIHNVVAIGNHAINEKSTVQLGSV